MPTMERCQEGDHAQVQIHTSRRRVVGPYVSLSLRMPEVFELLSGGIDVAPKFFEFVTLFKNPARIAESLGFIGHPLWQQTLQTAPLPGVNIKRDRRHRELVILNHLLYSKDPEAQYSRFVQARSEHIKKKAAKNRNLQRWLKQFKVPAFQGQGAAALVKAWRDAVVGHLSENLLPGEFYSIPRSAMSVEPVEAVLQPPPSKRARLDTLEQEIEDWEETSVWQGWVRAQIFFRVIHTTASRAKVCIVIL